MECQVASQCSPSHAAKMAQPAKRSRKVRPRRVRPSARRRSSPDAHNPPPPDRPTDLLADTPIGDVLLGGAICLVGAGMAFALKHQLALIIAIGAGVVVSITVLCGRHTDPKWTVVEYLRCALYLVAGLVVAVAGFLVLWMSFCDC